MPDAQVRVRRRPVPSEPLVHGVPDYADSFELLLPRPDAHTAEEWVRTGLEQPLLRNLIVLVHRRVLRFTLGPQGSDTHILGWRIVQSTPDVLELTTGGPLMRAVIVARRTSTTSATASTFVFYERASTAHLWRVVGPLHRRVAPYLLKRAGRTLLVEPHSVSEVQP
jgi:hypothetical protein